MKKKRVLLISCSVILLCICVATGFTYALFTDSVSVGNHLQAGNLNVTLKRTNLEYSVLNENGELEVTTVEEDLDLTTSSANNVFGIDSTDIRIVPGSYFDAKLEIANAGNTAFKYSVQIKLLGDATALAEQLKVTINDANGNEIDSKMLSELANDQSIEIGKMKVGADAQSFSVRVEFIDDVAYNLDLTEDAEPEDYMNNNDAQTKTAVFDLIVTAVQATTQD